MPVKTLIDYLQGGDRLEDFLNDFPTVTKNRALQVLDLAKDALLSNLDETLASRTWPRQWRSCHVDPGGRPIQAGIISR